jgi:hypothetical protein
MKITGTLFGICLLNALLLALPAAVQAQLTFTTNSGAITITGCTGNPTALNIPDTTNGYHVTSIATQAFLDKTALTNVSIGTNVTIIGYQAFGGCNALTSIILPDSVTNIGQYAFEPCASLASVKLPSHLAIIPSEMFGDCSALTGITIPGSVTNIQSAAFDNCSGLTAVYFLGNEPTPGANIFHGVNAAVAKVYYQAGTMGWGATYGGLTTVLLNPISDIGVQDNQFGFTYTGTNTQIIVVEASTNLASVNWQPIQTDTLSGTTFNFTDSQWKFFPFRFYRVGTGP